MSRRCTRALASQAGYSLVEMLISTAIMLVVTGAIFTLMNPAQGNAQAQPEVADIQQRMRVGTDVLFKEIMMAGAGPYQGPVTGSLVNFFASIVPRRVGDVNPDPVVGAGSFTTDKITLTYIPNSYSQTTISASMPPQSAELKVNDQPNCPSGQELCGFTEGMDVIIFDTTGNWDTFTITHVQDSAGHLQHRGQDLNYAYDVGASVTQVVSNTFYLNRATNQLMNYDGHSSDVPAGRQRRRPDVPVFRRPESADAAEAGSRVPPTASTTRPGTTLPRRSSRRVTVPSSSSPRRI